MAKLEYALYRCDQIKMCEQQALHYQWDEDKLMSRAGAEAFFFLQETYPQINNIAVFCGAGNNAGDGYVLARLAHDQGMTVIVYQCKELQELPSAAKNAALLAIDAGVDCQPAGESLDGDVEFIVDALLGTGIQGAVRGVIASVIHQINTSGLPVLSLDIPSGLNADTGLVKNFSVRATETLTFVAPKAGMYTADGPDYCGEIHYRSLQLDTYLANFNPYAFLLNDTAVSSLTVRKKNSHKGDYGKILIIGGGPGMPGAVSLTARAAMRTGAGTVTIATWPDHVQSILPLLPEAMIWGIQTAKELQELLANASLCVIGPGLGECAWAKTLFLTAIRSQLPMIIDASALRMLSEYPQIDDNWILTPHPGEAASLLSCTSAEIQANRYESAIAIQQLYGGVVVLKGSGTVIQTLEKNIFVCSKGNPGMATAGMGDILSGIIAGLCAQGLSLSEAAKLGVWVHAMAGDQVASTMGNVGFLASDLLETIPTILNCIKK